MDERVQQIRESERRSHITQYRNTGSNQSESWMSRPVKTVQDLLPHFAEYSELRVLDFGCGVGRNCIPIAKEFSGIPCRIDCVDILDIAVEKLTENAEKNGVASGIHGIVSSIEDYPIRKNAYDLILAISALEHVASEECFVSKLKEMKQGVREKGIACLILNTNVREFVKETGEKASAQFEVNLSTEKMRTILMDIFCDWQILKDTVIEQSYDIPRDFGISKLETTVVTLAARKQC